MERGVKNNKGEHNEIFNRLKVAVLDAALNEHQWDSKAVDYLVSLEVS